MTHNLIHPTGEKREKTFGEAVFDSVVYGGIGYLGNAAISLAVTHHAMNLPNSWLGRNSPKSKALFEEVMKTVTDNPETIKSWASRANDILFLGSGGWALVIPMKWMEDNKPGLVQTINHAFGTGAQTDAGRAEERQQLETGVRQSYLSLFTGRAITYPIIIAAAIPVMTTFKGNEYLSDVLEKHVPHWFEGFTNPKKLIDITSQEIILAGTGAVLLYGFSKAVASLQHRAKEKKVDSELPSPSISHVQMNGSLRPKHELDSISPAP